MNSIGEVSATDAQEVFQTWVDQLDEAIGNANAQSVAAMFEADGYWRDLLALTWEFKTFSGRAEIARGLSATLPSAGIGYVKLATDRSPPVATRRSGRSIVEGYIELSTRHGIATGFVRLTLGQSGTDEPRIWQLLTALQHLHGFEEKTGRNRPTGENYSKIETPRNWRQERDIEQRFVDRDPEVVIIGAGQSGLMLAARLRQMGTDLLVVEKTSRVGDVWRYRYNNLTLHNELHANHFPYMPFPDTWPTYIPKDMMGAWLEAYAEFMELNVWTGTELIDSGYDDKAKMWSITLRRPDGTERRMQTRHVVAALGISGGVPKIPEMPGLEDFKGTVVHSARFSTGTEWKGKRAVVVGTGNSGHDIAQDLHVSGAKVSLMQRGPTCVVSLEPSASISYAVYNEGRPIDDVDLMVAAIPYPVLIETYQWITRKTEKLDAELLRQLDEIGFKTHTGPDETGFQLLYLRGAGGYYIDVGCSRLLIERKIGLMQADDMDRFVADGIRQKDGSVVKCDLVVMATGFESMQENIRRLMGDKVAERVGPVWGFDDENNVRNMWKRTGQEGFWIMGGAIIEARIFSRYLALQLKASLEGILPEVSDLPLSSARRDSAAA